MTAKQPRASLVAGTMALPLIAALVFWRPAISEPDSSPARPLVQLPPDTARAAPARSHVPTESQPSADPRIAKTLDDPGVTFRGIRPADGANQVMCGEVRASGRSYYRRFAWIAEAQLLAIDDGGPDFARLGKLCDGDIGLTGSQNR
ncbi:hypothetical protein [Sphingopyxis sp. JAI108]|uniref:hypothetical protein n=1 Tax=Sphingopyxis sp. JAI108 TaxID=2723060 RepID=UPI0015CB68A6|nr:hypothetical protein [Sphingopyxis sp. JAI108]NYF30631.1 hypothetical protein [Sphingopyxis sp. JAI108]